MIQGWEWSDEWRGLWKEMVRAARGGDMARAKQLWADHQLFLSLRGSAMEADLWTEIASFKGQQWIRDDQREVMSDVEQMHSLLPATLLLTGALDMADFRLMADLLEGAVPQISRIDFADAGHMLDLEKPQEIAAEICKFIVGG